MSDRRAIIVLAVSALGTVVAAPRAGAGDSDAPLAHWRLAGDAGDSSGGRLDARNLGGVTLERDCRSAARDAVTGASRRSPAVLKSQPDEFPGERPPRGQEENRRQGCEADSVPCPHGLGRHTSVRTP